MRYCSKCGSPLEIIKHYSDHSSLQSCPGRCRGNRKVYVFQCWQCGAYSDSRYASRDPESGSYECPHCWHVCYEKKHWLWRRRHKRV